MAYLKIRVTPGARRDEIAGWLDDTLKLRVKAPPERGKANEAAVDLIAQTLGIRAKDVLVERGTTSRDKLLRIDGLTADELKARLRSLSD